ncbi:MAG TPA: TIGR00730 family Rossman fold protein [Cyclobacteriaceae bacterium]|nr:TIGR00730 family Rossman fold protein [Cyclobacteriaceae bacterium]HQQ96010.1 TIGR00730 family Rossman fold protein [Cyclobacteriaceae bacterium]
MNVCVFCGSATGHHARYSDAARSLGELIAIHGHTLIYGGGNIGLMGIVADATLQHGGKVTGVIPDFLMKREVGHRGLTELVIVDSMHERKKKMADLADVFIALPGGWGTLDELAEILTWRQLRLVNQPIGLLNLQGFFTPLVDQMKIMTGEGFLAAENLKFLTVADSPVKLLTALGVVTD